MGDVAGSARLAEELGLDSVWSTDHLIASAPILDGTIVLAAAAGATSRIRLGFGVMLLALRPVAWAAKQIASLQQVSGNRLVLGVGTGNPAHGDIAWRAAGMSFEDRGRRTDQALGLLPGLVAGEPTDLGDGVTATLTPGAPMPPVLIAGNGNRALRRAAAYGDGWVAIGISPAEVTGHLKTLGELASARERPRPGITVMAPDVEQISAYAEAGAERLILAPTGPDSRKDYEFAASVRQSLH